VLAEHIEAVCFARALMISLPDPPEDMIRRSTTRKEERRRGRYA
jgi:hypothetical protein